MKTVKNEAVEDLNAGASYEEIQDEVEDLPLEQFCQQLDFLVKSDDPKAKALYDTFRKGWKQEFKNIKVTQAFVNIRELHPTQNVIFAHKSLDLILNGKWRMPGAIFAVDVLLGDEKPQVEMGDPIVVCNVGGVDYLIDGHHRWSKAYAFNPSCSMKAYIINEAFENADEVLKFAQGTLTILKNKSPINTAQPSNDINLYDITPRQLSDLVNASLNREVLEHIRNLPVTQGIVNDPSTLVSYLWSNVRILRQYAPMGAHDREFMPQFPDGDTNPASAVAKIKENSKITLTIKQLKKLVKESMLDMGIRHDDASIDEYQVTDATNPLTGKSRQSAQRFVYKVIGDHKGMCRDDNWKHVHEIFGRMRAAGLDLSYGPLNDREHSGGYFRNEQGQVAGKEWEFTIDFINNRDRECTITGRVIASFGGTVDQAENDYIGPDRPYDIVVTLY